MNRHKDTCSHLHHGDDMKKRSRGPRAGPGCSDAGEALHEKLMKMACVDDMVRILADKGTMESAE